MSKKKTHEEYVAELAIKNPDIEVIEEYVNAITPILHRCKIDGHEWMVTPNNLLRGHGCSVCANVLKKTHDNYIEELHVVNPNIIVVGGYNGAHVPIEHYCQTHNIFWNISPTNALNGNGCPECGKEKIKCKLSKEHVRYVQDVEDININIDVVGQYINAKTAILHRCKIDGCEWYAQPNNVLSGTGCPQCNESRGEREVRQWMYDHNLNYIHQKTFDDCRNKQLLPFDFYLPEHNLCIEYDGEQHFRAVDYFGGDNAFQQRVHNDNIKTTYCTEHNINLLRIPYYKNVKEELDKFFIHLI